MPEEVDDTPELPQEMLDLIMSFLRDDSAALKCCSLVCKAWCWSAQSYLFRDLVVLDRNKDPALKMPVSASPYYNVTHYVRGFHVQGVQFDNVPTYPKSVFSSLSCMLTRLHLFRCHFDDLDSLVHIIQMCPSIQDLHLENVHWDKNGTASLASRESWSPSALTHLGLKDIRIAPFLRWLTLSTKPLFITHLKFDPIKPEDLPIICHLCSRVNKSVTFLQICLAMEDGLISYLPCQVSHELQSLATSSHIARLYSNTFNIPNYKSRPTLVQLVTLRVDRFMDSTNEIDKQSNSLSWTARILSKVDAPDTFKYLILQMVISRTGQLDECRVTRWDFFDEALGGDIFVNFQYLEFEMVGKVDMEGVTSLLSRRLPKLAQRGRLRFTNVI
ncbi:hypothetical protein D9613_010097 [Agrocybe pediades]|uniref:F-box domain-containing protein n=1 Tax=Agrocybe pediades TaxID=84607 RepID=A0A8H4QW96_9AGAR|nr:hypothetical protein D9613_010097 [Agrocybe pediades]